MAFNPYESPKSPSSSRKGPELLTQIVCDCGLSIGATASIAGMNVTCECGASVPVPSLGRLRELAGRHPYEVSTVDVIAGMIERGDLPAGDQCAVLGGPTLHVLVFQVEVERAFVERGPALLALVAGLLAALAAPLFFFPLLWRERAGPRGRDTIVSAPLRVSPEGQKQVRLAGQRALKRWLRTVPVYKKLLKEYPEARVWVA